MPQIQKQQIDYQIDNQATDQVINCEPVMIGQVLVNLISNAAQALEDTPDARIVVNISDCDEWMLITVTDNGPGMDSDVMANLFEPFFTTKEKGLGLGLTISRRIVESQNGTLTVKAVEPNGTAFTITLLKELHGDNT